MPPRTRSSRSPARRAPASSSGAFRGLPSRVATATSLSRCCKISCRTRSIRREGRRRPHRGEAHSLARSSGRPLGHRRIDEGPGIAPEHLPRLTERFYRVDVASSREKGGTGLGLAIVKHILNRHRGELAIASTRGKGSTFTVMLSEVKTALPERGAAAS